MGCPPPLHTLNSPPTHTPPTSCCPILLQGIRLAPMGARGTRGMGVLRGGRQEVLPRTLPWVGCAGGQGAPPRLVVSCGHPWGPVQPLPVMGGGGVSGGPTSPAPRRRQEARMGGHALAQRGGWRAMGALDPCGCHGGGAPWGWGRGCPTAQPSVSRDPLLVPGGVPVALGAGGGRMRGAGCCSSVHPEEPRTGGRAGGAREGDGGPGAARTPCPSPSRCPPPAPI